jgi:hypothetical protein
MGPLVGVRMEPTGGGVPLGREERGAAPLLSRIARTPGPHAGPRRATTDRTLWSCSRRFVWVIGEKCLCDALARFPPA